MSTSVSPAVRVVILPDGCTSTSVAGRNHDTMLVRITSREARKLLRQSRDTSLHLPRLATASAGAVSVVSCLTLLTAVQRAHHGRSGYPLRP